MEDSDAGERIAAAAVAAVISRLEALPNVKIQVAILTYDTTAGEQVYEVEVGTQILPHDHTIGA